MAETDRSPLDNVILAALRANLDEPVGDLRAPKARASEIAAGADKDSDAMPPFHIYVPMGLGAGGRSGPSFSDAMYDDAVWIVQVTSVGRNREEAQFAADMAARVLIGRDDDDWLVSLDVPADVGNDVTGLLVTMREQQSTSGPIAVGSLVHVSDRFEIYTSPSD